MKTVSSPFSPQELRQLVLQQQGLLKPQQGKGAVARVVSQLGYVQIDSINVVERAHHHVLFNRVRRYRPELLSQACEQQELFEYWAHAAAFLPMADFRFSLQRKMPLRDGATHWFNPEQELMQQILRTIATQGALPGRFFTEAGSSQGGWWNWQPAKQALEQLFMQGHLSVLRQGNFQKLYELTDRLYPHSLEMQAPSEQEFAEHLIERTLQSQAVATAAQICYLRKNCKAQVQQVLTAAVQAGRLCSFVQDGQSYYYSPQLVLTDKVPDKVWLLSPFDNLVIQRDRLRQLFNFDYQIEVYVPAEKRKVGYYSLPILYRDRFVGQVDVKAERKLEVLTLQHLVIEPGIRLTEGLRHALVKALRSYADFNQCTELALKKASPELRQWLMPALAER
ncbi:MULTISPECIES: winged helix-turn-helix domain-containing protein [Rheinheimera]|uniref:Winged helix-turn-helix domain-containing protein n=1 Tax=Rheinheimera marina TaxID=1774958 RepID=A0ABV9JLT5_9GAMM